MTQAAANNQHEIIDATRSTTSTFSRNAHPDAQWFPEADLGLFIHWGVASTFGDVDLSWGMMRDTPWDRDKHHLRKVTPSEYWHAANQFQPTRYDPHSWLADAAKAGFTYAVLTTKHHDGYTLWPSDHSAIGTHTHLDDRDLVEPFVQACRDTGLRWACTFRHRTGT